MRRIAEQGGSLGGHRLAKLLNPSAVAVVGATDRLGAFTGDTVHNLLRYGYGGRIYPVNPRRTSVLGLPCFPSVRELPGPVDCAVLSVSADRVVEILEDCAAVGIGSAIVTASGFGEGGAGEAGVARRRELDRLLAENSMPILGPSTTGLINLFDGFVPRAATNMLPREAVKSGAVAVISQSGACNNIIFNRAQDRGLGVGLAVATGLQAAVSIWDVADYALQDERVSVLSFLVEDLGPAEKWRPILEAARRTGRSVVLCKLGRSQRGAEALRTHSGAMAGSWQAQEQALRDAGALIATDLDQLWEVASLCVAWGPPTGPVRLGAVAMSGGEGALISDLAEEAGLSMPPATTEFQEVVAQRLTLTRGANPFDPSGEILGRPQHLEPILEAFVDQPALDRVLIAWHVLDSNVLVKAWPRLHAWFARHRHRVVLSGWPLSALGEWRRLQAEEAPPFIPGSHRAVAAVACYSRYSDMGESVVEGAAPPVEMPFPARPTYQQARDVFAALGVPFARQVPVVTFEQAMEAAEALGWPLVLKADVDSTVHKSAAGLVHVGLRNQGALQKAWFEVNATMGERVRSFLVEEHLLGEVQVFVGMRVDPEVGPLLLLGFGGAAVEFLSDVALGAARLSALDHLIQTSAVGRFLDVRAPDALAEIRTMCSALVALSEDERVESAELNPVIIDLCTQEARAVDARISMTTALDGG